MADSLAELLLSTGLVTSAGVAAARDEAARSRKDFAVCLIDLGLVNERRLAESVAQASDTLLLDSIDEHSVAAVQHYIPKAVARELQVVPLRVLDGQLFVVMVNPLNAEAIDILRAATARAIQAITGVRSDIARLVNRFYVDPATDEETPFHFSNETLLRRPPELDFLRDAGTYTADPFATIAPRDPATLPYLHDAVPVQNEEEFGTMIARPADRDLGTLSPPPVPPDQTEPPREDTTAPTNPFVGIERRLDQIVGMIRNIENRLDRLESVLQEHAVRR